MLAQSRPTLLLTRPAAASARFAAQVAARFGDRVAVVIAPLLAPEFRDAAVVPGAAQQVIFTAETGVAGLARLTAERGRAYCVGPQTAAVAQAAGWDATELGGDAEGLIAGLIARRPTGRWLHARAREVVTDLAGRLGAAGIVVDEITVYAQEVQPMPPAGRELLAGAAPVILSAFSPRSGVTLVAAAGVVRAPRTAIAISAAAAATLAPLAPARMTIAVRPDADGMLDALARLLDGGSDG